MEAVDERHRHRWEFNNRYRDALDRAGLRASGVSPDGRLVEIAELRDHPFMMGSQFHPELRSRPGRPHPLFVALMDAALTGGQGAKRPSRRASLRRRVAPEASPRPDPVSERPA